MKTLLISLLGALLVSCQTDKAFVVSNPNLHQGIVKGNKDQVVELCPELKQGQILDFEINANLPVLFNLHYHQGKSVSYPIPEKNLTNIKQQFQAPSENTYCLMWKTHLKDTKVTYSYSVQ